MSYITYDPRAASYASRSDAISTLAAARLAVLERETHRTANAATWVFCGFCFVASVAMFLLAI